MTPGGQSRKETKGLTTPSVDQDNQCHNLERKDHVRDRKYCTNRNIDEELSTCYARNLRKTDIHHHTTGPYMESSGQEEQRKANKFHEKRPHNIQRGSGVHLRES